MHSLITVPVQEIPEGDLEHEVLVVVRMQAAAGETETVQRELSGALQRIRAGVPECTSILGFSDPSAAGRFLLYERWRTLGEFRQYLLRPEMIEYLGRLDGLLESRDIAVMHEFAEQP